MRALCWHGKGDVRVDTVPDPKIQHSRDAIIKITACAICGSDLHLLDGYQPTMESGDILGHENMGEVLELGSEDIVLKRLSDGHVFAPAQIDQIVENLAALEKLGAGVTRYGASLPEYELADTGVFADSRYFDVQVEYAKAGTDDSVVVDEQNPRLHSRNARPGITPQQ